MRAILLGVILGMLAPAAAADWWRDEPDTWGGAADNPWGSDPDEAWWLEPGEEDPWGTAGRREDPARRHPWTGLPAEPEPEKKRRTYDPWSDWTDRPWGDTGSRSRREEEGRRRRHYQDGPEYRPPPPQPPPPYPGYGPGSWGGVPFLPPLPPY